MTRYLHKDRDPGRDECRELLFDGCCLGSISFPVIVTRVYLLSKRIKPKNQTNNGASMSTTYLTLLSHRPPSTRSPSPHYPVWLLWSAASPVRKNLPSTRSFLLFQSEFKPHCSLHVRLWGHRQIQASPSSFDFCISPSLLLLDCFVHRRPSLLVHTLTVSSSQ